MKIGVLALQGDFAEHIAVLERIGVDPSQVRTAEQLHDLDGLIIPGGESTTIGKLATTFGLLQPLKAFAGEHPIWGTCAGAILLSKDAHRDQPLLQVMDITIDRNAFGRQVDSFETNLMVPSLTQSDRPFRAVFIRAPIIEKVGENVEVLARLQAEAGSNTGVIVAAQEGMHLATAFHPELTEDDRFHRYFLQIVESQ
jgi:5'-phosphate synthase pdxT subunit